MIKEYLNNLYLKLYFRSFVRKYKHYFAKHPKQSNVKPRLFWGMTPILNNKYWSEAMKEIGFSSKTVMTEFYGINRKSDYDEYIYETFPHYWSRIKYFYQAGNEINRLKILFYIAKNFDVLHMPMDGLILRNGPFKNNESALLKMAGCKVVIIPYGSDSWMYSRVMDWTLLHGLMISYPDAAKNEHIVSKNVSYWKENADIIITSFANDGIGRYDVLPFNILCINTDLWKSKENYNDHDGTNGIVKIVHTPNHRGGKGTDYIIAAIEKLKSEGLKIELILIEKRLNDEVRKIMHDEADILIEQILSCTYALSGIEGMATGLPVIARLDDPRLTNVFRRYSYLNECPILSANHENVYERVKLLVKNPQLRNELGKAGRDYVIKYHSYNTTQYVFGRIYDKVWHGKDVDLINLFHPLNPDSFNNKSPLIKHPLVENKIPNQLLEKLNK